jgi:hypothetical protein
VKLDEIAWLRLPRLNSRRTKSACNALQRGYDPFPACEACLSKAWVHDNPESTKVRGQSGTWYRNVVNGTWVRADRGADGKLRWHGYLSSQRNRNRTSSGNPPPQGGMRNDQGRDNTTSRRARIAQTSTMGLSRSAHAGSSKEAAGYYSLSSAQFRYCPAETRYRNQCRFRWGSVGLPTAATITCSTPMRFQLAK